MPFPTQPLISIYPLPPTHISQELKQILNAVVQGAFGGETGIRPHLTEHADHAVLELEFSPEAPRSVAGEIAIRLAMTTLQLITILGKELGAQIRQSSSPYRRMMTLPGLTWYRLRLRLGKLIAAQESPTSISLNCASTGISIRITIGQPLGYLVPVPSYLCDSVVQRRVTSKGEIVRVRCGRYPISIVLPRDVSATEVSDGMLLSTAHVVGQIPRRLVQLRRCQLSLFNES